MADTVSGPEPIEATPRLTDTKPPLLAASAHLDSTSASMSDIPLTVTLPIGSKQNDNQGDDQVHPPAVSANQNEAEEVGTGRVHEKLHEDDRRQQARWKTVLYKVLPFLENVEDLRRVTANNPLENSRHKYVNNVVVTSKYNIITFLPLNLFEQFLRVANVYFLILVILQSIPQLSSVPVYSTLVPLLLVLAVTAIKDAFDDIKRHRSDYHVNNRPVEVLRDGSVREVRWSQVVVGDVLKLERDDYVTADLLLISSSEPNSLIYVETAELDGETNLKVRQALPATAHLYDHMDLLAGFNGYIECEPPNNRLHKFVGTLQYNGQQYSLDNEKIVLRGCRLRNTKWMYGVVIYAGHDTKLMQNSGRTKFKRTHLDITVNKLVFSIFFYLIVLLIFCFIGSMIFENLYGSRDDVKTFLVPTHSPFVLSILQIFSNWIVLNTFIPISLYVTVEVIRLGLSLLINWDGKMYYEPNNVPAIARTTTLNEELGQIEYIFSDKTGTLTQNIMVFLKCSINGERYGEITTNTNEKNEKSVPAIDFKSWNNYADKKFVYYDAALLEKCRSLDPHCAEFFRILSLCHTVIPNEEDGELQYNAQSPDEAALVGAAKNFGFVFKVRTPFIIQLLNLHTGNEEQYEVLHILDFNNERKRMSVIVKTEDKIMLYCKGADNVIFERLDRSAAHLMSVTQDHLSDYANDGLRTLVIAKKEIDANQYELWRDEHHKASVLQKGRDQALDAVYEKIEKNLILVGATAIEDKLQDGVPETIAKLAKANIKIWVLTGDKQETAVNIGYSSQLLTGGMRVFVVDKESESEVFNQLMEIKDIMTEPMHDTSNGTVDNNSQDVLFQPGTMERQGSVADGSTFGIVINGHSLRHALKEQTRDLLLETAERCQAVICCRVTPLQKKKVVDLVKNKKKAVTLAIGDGANDVGMIKAAHIGVGISGLEGQQAVLASDYSFGQFRYLERLLLVHGRWSYHRMTLFLRYFFYKNFAFTFSQFIFAFFCGFSAQTLYDPVYIAVYNVIYTSLPVFALGIADQDLSEQKSLNNPRLYIAGQQNKSFNIKIFVLSLLRGISVAIVIFFVLFGISFCDIMPLGGYEWDYQSFGLAASAALTVVVNLQIAYDIYYWNPFMHVFIWASIILWFVVIPFTSTAILYPSISNYVGVAYEVLKQPGFWFYVPLVCAIALFPVITYRTLLRDFFPTLVDELMLSEKGKSSGPKGRLNKKSRQRRSGYAFSHQEGFGDFIESGRGFGLPQDQVEAERKKRLSKVLTGETNGPPVEVTVPPGEAIEHRIEASQLQSKSKNARDTETAEKDGPHSQLPSTVTATIPNIPGTPIHGVSSQDSVVIC
eukprot:Em0009g526a